MASTPAGFITGTAATGGTITYTCDPNIDTLGPANTCATLNGAIAGIYQSTFSNANATIYVQYGNTGVGMSNQVLAGADYGTFRNALSANSSGNTIDVAALASLPTNEPPEFNNGSVFFSAALGSALGLGGLSGVTASLSICNNPGTAGCYNGVITVATPGLNLISYYYRSGPQLSFQYDFFTVVEHETDEILGMSSCIHTDGPGNTLVNGCGGTNVSAADLFRYSGVGARVVQSTAPGAYFSHNGGATNVAVYNTLANGEDYGDWVTNCQHVQDATACLGQSFDITSNGGVEITVLDAVGFNRNYAPPAITETFTPALITLGGTTTLIFTINNPNLLVPLTGLAFTDNLPSGVVVASPPNEFGSCNGTVTGATPGSVSFAFSGGSVNPNASCIVALNVTGIAAGTTNNSATVSSIAGGTGNTTIAALTVVAPPFISMVFNPSAIALNQQTFLVITIANPAGNTVALNGVAFGDTLPAGLTVVNSTSNICGGTVVTTAPTGISFSGGTVPFGGQCVFSVGVIGAASGGYTNGTGTVSSTNGGIGNTATANLTVGLAPPSLSLSLFPTSIPLNGITSLIFNMLNPAGNTAPLTGVAFSDTLPTGLTVPNETFPACGGTVVTTAPTGIAFSGGTIAVGPPCGIPVTVTGAASGSYTIVTGAVTSTNGGTGNTATANVTVNLAPPSISKVFSPASIAFNGTSLLTFTIVNPAGNTVALNGVGFSDTLPTGLTAPNATFPACGGTVVTTAPTGISFSGATIAAGGTCQFGVTVTGAVSGNYTNVTGAVSSTNGGAGNTATANLTVNLAPPSISKAFGPASIALNGTSLLTFTIVNPAPNTAALNGVSFSDTLPAGLTVANNTGAFCGGTAITNAPAGIAFSGATIAAGGTCQFSVTVTGAAPGSYTNVTGAVTSTNGGTGNTATANLTVIAPPSISKAFNPKLIPFGGSSGLIFTIVNPVGNTVPLTGVAFSDTLSAGLTVANNSGAFCGGTAITTAPTGIAFSGATIAAGGTCQFSVTVTGAAPGSYTNTTGAVNSANGGAGNTASANLTVTAPPSISKAFNPISIPLNGTTSLAFTITNPNTGTDTFTATGSMSASREIPTATLLNNGKVLIAGGFNPSYLASAELYDPATGLFTATGSMATARNQHTATLLNDGKVLIAGGYNGSYLASAELYDPATGLFTATGSMTTAHDFHTATLLNNGKVLIAGGNNPGPLASAELYDPATGLFTATGSMTTSRNLHTATLLNNGKVLMAGGYNGSYLASAELYDPATGLFSATGSMTTARNLHRATLLNNGKVIMAGGYNGIYLASAELYDPATGLFTATGSMTAARDFHAATLLNNGLVLITGGQNSVYLASAELYDPGSGAFTSTGSMTTYRNFHTATLLNNGNVLVAGGFDGPDGTYLASAELYNAATTLTGVNFTDTLPTGLTVVSSSSSVCGGTLTTTASTGIALSGATAVSGSPCAFNVTVTGAAVGSYTNTTGNVSSTNGGIGNTATATVNVVALPPVISKVFTPARILPGGTSVVSFQILNPYNSVSLTGVAFTDSLPSPLVVANPNGVTSNCGGTATAVAGSGTISLANGTISASNSCTVTVTVTAPEGIYPNSVQVTSTNGAPGNTATATLFVATPPNLSKGFGVVSMGPQNTTTLSFTLKSPNTVVALTGLAFSDPLIGFIVATPNGLAGSCGGGTVTAVAGSSSISLANATLAGGASCTFSVNVTSTTAGPLTNTTSPVTSNQAVASAAASAGVFVGDPFQVTYASNLTLGDSFIDITNTGSSGAALPSGTTANITGAICANVYAFTPDEQMVSCCSCPVTPNGLVSLSAQNDLASNTLTPAVPTALVVKILATLPVAGSCNNSAAAVGTLALANGIKSFGTTLHATPAAGTYGVTERPFSTGTLSTGELSRLANLCNFILANGSGFGVCRSCRLGGLGSDRQ